MRALSPARFFRHLHGLRSTAAYGVGLANKRPWPKLDPSRSQVVRNLRLKRLCLRFLEQCWVRSSATYSLGLPFSPACVAHKSLEICKRRRLWQRNSPATPEIPLLFGEKNLKQFVSIHLFETGSLKTRSVC